MYERILPRIGAGCGAVFVLLLFGLPLTGSDSTIVLVGELIGLLLFIPFLGYLSSVLRDAEGPGGWLAATAFGAGLVDITIKLASIAPANAADGFADATPTHQALDVMNSTAFIATMLPLSVFMAAVAVVIVRTRVLPRWLGWLAAVTAPLLLVNGMFLDAEFGPAFLLFLLWVLLASVILSLRPGDVGSPSEPVRPMPTTVSRPS
jgi:hypothetical protein